MKRLRKIAKKREEMETSGRREQWKEEGKEE